MIKRLLLAALIWLASWPALAQVPTTGAGQGAPSSGGGGSPTYTPTAGVCQVAGFSNTTTFTGVAYGTGLVVVGVADDQAGSYTSATMTIGGNSATQVAGATVAGASLFYANVTGSSGNIVLTAPATALDIVCISVGYLTSLSSSTPTASTGATYGGQAQPFALGSTLTVNSGGFGIVFLGVQNYSSNLPIVWTGATNDSVTGAENAGGNELIHGSGHMTSSANPTGACTTACSFGATSVIGASWR